MDEETEKPPTPTAESLKGQGNQAVKNQKFEEALLHYTHAIKLDPDNYTLYSNRSFAFLKVQQYYLAREDACATIKLCPQWPKGYFRKGEVEYATGHYMDAYESYKEALRLKPDDILILEALNKAAKDLLKEKEADRKIPWVGAGVGIVLGVSVVIADSVFAIKPTHPMLMALVTIVIALVGYGVAKFYRYYMKGQRNSLLEPPLGLFDDELSNNSLKEEKEEIKKTPRYTKSQARMRYKKGKM